LGHEVTQPLEISLVPALQIESVPACGITGFLTASPWSEIVFPDRGECVASDVEGALGLDIGRTREQTSVVQSLSTEGREIFPEVERAIQYGTVVFAAPDDDQWTTTPFEVA